MRRERLDFHTLLRSFRALHANAFLTFKSRSVELTHDPRYLKSLTFLRAVPSVVLRGGCSGGRLYAMNSVFFCVQSESHLGTFCLHSGQEFLSLFNLL